MNVYFFPTFQCTLHCPRCYQRKLNPPMDYMMSWDEFKENMSSLKKIVIEECVFTGGEPTLWPYLVKAVNRMKQIAKKVRIVSNGFQCSIEDYGDADVIQVSDYGAVNRMDIYRLKKQDRKRVRIQESIHWDWDRSISSELPGICGCVGLSFVGKQSWPCAMAAAAKDEKSIGKEPPFAPYQDLCKTCLVNKKNRKAPKPVFQFGFWEFRSWLIGK